MNLGELLNVMRSVLTPKGRLPLVHLSLRNHGFVDHALVSSAIDEFERLAVMRLTESTPLERLGVLLLLGSIPGLDYGHIRALAEEAL